MSLHWLPRGATALAALVGLVATAEAQHRTGVCPPLDTFIVTEDGPPRPSACLFDQAGRVQAAIIEYGSYGPRRVVVFSEAAPYNSVRASLVGRSNVVHLAPGERPSSFEALSPAAWQEIERLVGPLTSERVAGAGREVEPARTAARQAEALRQGGTIGVWKVPTFR
jgi:hypothetical protein